ncbi:DUF7674 family protein [Telluria antibiotica]|uniref:DUF7674 family protein n=1 Tax=Telluria antibiotica TaxID=2717319 RepID=UPI003FCC56FC
MRRTEWLAIRIRAWSKGFARVFRQRRCKPITASRTRLGPTADDVSFTWVEACADRTTEAIRRRDSEVVQSHTNFIAAAYRAEPEALRTIVDVAYAENLMWDAGPEDRAGRGSSLQRTFDALITTCG